LAIVTALGFGPRLLIANAPMPPMTARITMPQMIFRFMDGPLRPEDTYSA
jgi:hypothetical protein